MEEDVKALISQIAEEESRLRLKRRWLMDLSLSNREEERVEEILPSSDRMLAESFLREDDLSYEDIRKCVEMAFGVHKLGSARHFVQPDVQILDLCDDLNDIFALLDSMTNKGLSSIIKLLTGGSIKFEKTNWSMKRTIKELLPKVIGKDKDMSKTKVKQLFKLLRNPKYFHGNHMAPSVSSEAYHAAAVKLLEELELFPSRTLLAMLRRLRCIRGYVPSLQPRKCGKGRDSLISLVRKKCMKMLPDLDKMGKPAEPLFGALGVAGLTLKLILNRPAPLDFRKFSPDVEVLQNDIAKAIWLLNEEKNVSLIELRRVVLLVDPKAELSARRLRAATRNLLTDYLFECSEMEKVPDSLAEILNIINGRPKRRRRRKSFSSKIQSSPKEIPEEEVQNEVEYILTVSAEAKEVVMNLLPEHEFDKDFAHAYMEDFELPDSPLNSEDDDKKLITSQQCQSHFQNSYFQTESIGEVNLEELNSCFSTRERDICLSPVSSMGRLKTPLELLHISEMVSGETCGHVHPLSKELDEQCMDKKQHPSGNTIKLERTDPDYSNATDRQDLFALFRSSGGSSSQSGLSNETKSCSTATPKLELCDIKMGNTDPVGQQSICDNQYLEVQEACDATSMTAYRFVGHMLMELAKNEGLELYQEDDLYLRSSESFHEDSEESPPTMLTSKFSSMWKRCA